MQSPTWLVNLVLNVHHDYYKRLKQRDQKQNQQHGYSCFFVNLQNSPHSPVSSFIDCMFHIQLWCLHTDIFELVYRAAAHPFLKAL